MSFRPSHAPQNRIIRVDSQPITYYYNETIVMHIFFVQ
jgi:hypothetical protein